MSATKSKRRRGGGHEAGEDERWLLTYADMITLLMALFMVLFSISSVNVSKYESLQRSLKDAFSGRILPGGEGVVKAGGAEKATNRPSIEDPIPAIHVSPKSAAKQTALKREDEDFRRLKAQIDRYAKEQGLQAKIETIVTRRGLVIRVLTDKLLFDSGYAAIKPRARPLLLRVAQLLRTDTHPVAVEGHTDAVPISGGGRYRSNWDLSTARASSVVLEFIRDGVPERRFEAAGLSSLYPIDSNETTAGRSRNRRVEVVLLRRGLARQKGPLTP